MSLMELLTADMKAAMKQGEKARLSVIRLVRGAVRQAEIDGKKTLNDDEIINVIAKEVKMRRDSIEEFERGKRADLVETTKAEIDILTDCREGSCRGRRSNCKRYEKGHEGSYASHKRACGWKARQRNHSLTFKIIYSPDCQKSPRIPLTKEWGFSYN